MQVKGNRVGKGYGTPGLVLLMAGLSVLGACSIKIKERNRSVVPVRGGSQGLPNGD